MQKRLFVSFVVCFYLCVAGVLAQEAGKQDSVVIEIYDSSDGMLPGFVTNIYQDRKGNLWIGTAASVLHLHRFATSRTAESGILECIDRQVALSPHQLPVWNASGPARDSMNTASGWICSVSGRVRHIQSGSG